MKDCDTCKLKKKAKGYFEAFFRVLMTIMASSNIGIGFVLMSGGSVLGSTIFLGGLAGLGLGVVSIAHFVVDNERDKIGK